MSLQVGTSGWEGLGLKAWFMIVDYLSGYITRWSQNLLARRSSLLCSDPLCSYYISGESVRCGQNLTWNPGMSLCPSGESHQRLHEASWTPNSKKCVPARLMRSNPEVHVPQTIKDPCGANDENVGKAASDRSTEYVNIAAYPWRNLQRNSV